MIQKAYLVTYSTGSYDTFYDHNDKVFFSKKKAEERCEELDKEHKIIEPMFLKDRDEFNYPIDITDEERNKTFWAAEYEADTYKDEHPEEFPDLWKRDMTKEESAAWHKQEDINEQKYEEILHQIVAKYHPEWSKKDIIKAIEIERNNETIREQEYGDASIEEIYVDTEIV